jgi:hypothetical protein
MLKATRRKRVALDGQETYPPLLTEKAIQLEFRVGRTTSPISFTQMDGIPGKRGQRASVNQ